MSPIHVTPSEKEILDNILQGPFDVLVFGSRVKGTHHTHSDLDICLKSSTPINLSLVSKIKEKLSNSDLPFLVDVVLYQDISDEFKTIIDREAVLLSDTQPV